jgi:hypothetical protein
MVMEAAAVVSAVVATVATGAAVAAWRAARRTAITNEEDIHLKLTPQFTADLETVESNGSHSLALRLNGPKPLDDVTVEILGDELAFTRGHHGVEPTDEGRSSSAWAHGTDGTRCGLRLGDSTVWRVVPTDDYMKSDEVTLRVEARSGKRTWEKLVLATVPKTMKPPPSPGSFRVPGST